VVRTQEGIKLSKPDLAFSPSNDSLAKLHLVLIKLIHSLLIIVNTYPFNPNQWPNQKLKKIKNQDLKLDLESAKEFTMDIVSALSTRLILSTIG
jgi:hypothetical protein